MPDIDKHAAIESGSVRLLRLNVMGEEWLVNPEPFSAKIGVWTVMGWREAMPESIEFNGKTYVPYRGAKHEAARPSTDAVPGVRAS